MTTLTIQNSSIKLPNKFQTEKDLFEFLINYFDAQTFLTKTSVKDLNTTEKEAWVQHQKDGYNDFIDFQG